MKNKIVFILLFAFISCSNDQDYLICNSSNSEHCKYFEIEYPNSIKEFQKLNIDAMGNELTIKDLNFYLNVNDTFLDKANSESIFHEFYNGVFIPRFSYSLLNRIGEEDLWFAIALYPVDKKNDLITTLDTFYNHEDLKFSNESIYGQCLNDKNSYLNSKNTKIFIYIALILLVLALDRISKILILNILENDGKIDIYVNSFISLFLVWNKGIGFGLFS